MNGNVYRFISDIIRRKLSALRLEICLRKSLDEGENRNKDIDPKAIGYELGIRSVQYSGSTIMPNLRNTIIYQGQLTTLQIKKFLSKFHSETEIKDEKLCNTGETINSNKHQFLTNHFGANGEMSREQKLSQKQHLI